jgi:nucleotide-binding universal stress UspA family protein
MYIPPATYDELQRSGRAAALRHLERLTARAKRAGVRVSSRLVEGAPVAEQIVRTARALRADVIVMGTHGRTGVARAVLGSVASRVVATSSCPVLTVRDQAR